MLMRIFACGGLALFCGALNGLSQNSQPASASNKAAGPRDLVAQVHWVGKNHLATDPSAAYVMNIWHLPASTQLEAQTLGKLALAFAKLGPQSPDSGAITRAQTLIRPLLDDVVGQESFFDMWQRGGEKPELAFGIRLDARRAALWQTNLAAAVESLTGASVARNNEGWECELRSSKGPAPATPSMLRRLRFVRSGEWTLLGLAVSPNAVLDSLLPRIKGTAVPHAPVPTNYWISAELELAHGLRALGCDLKTPTNPGRISVAVNGSRGGVRAAGEVVFSKPLALDLEPWNIPTNLVHDPLVAFTAIRGLRPFLATSGLWNDPSLGVPPNQVFAWALDGGPLLTDFAVPKVDADNWVKGVSKFLLEKVNPILQKHRAGSFITTTNGNGVRWTGIPLLAPFLDSVKLSGGGFAVGGLLPYVSTNQLAPKELYQAVLGPENLVCYDWEITEPRVTDWLYNSQVLRLMFERPQMTTNSAALPWLLAIAPRLGNCVTVVNRTKPNQLSFVRQSSIGFTAVELQLIADWLESPQFPRGLHTLLATNSAPKRVRRPGSAPVPRRPVVRVPPPQRRPAPKTQNPK